MHINSKKRLKVNNVLKKKIFSLLASFKSQIDEITHKAEKLSVLQVIRLKVSKCLKLNMMNGK